MSLSSVKKVYNIYSSFYDVLFGSIFHQGRSLCTNKVNKNAGLNASVLELGVGTGLSLPFYRPDLNITGIDISEKMLEKAEKRIVKKKLTTHIDLKIMDAANLEFPDNHFDFVVAMYVASVVPDIDAFLKEISRVCKPSGEIIFVNHFASEKPILRFLEKKLSHIDNFVGFNSNFSIHSILNYKEFKLLETQKVNLFGYWKLLHCKIN
ncbi:TPA: class I SAM-dependent methyltransferase [Legionella pneumophila]|nr:class I SAM-dependent methyltransferase [Legionella pneumophila]MDC8029237.1 Ubiquinone/menaquinone biosynthesis C-methylase UbiE/MenG [Legionella pneumophila subsp. pneumophila]MDW8868634.1 methyltransferase domain-containing protein [Legionella pneumophila]MDW8900890.1 methyltransferase domain-containing protein [Legionella pneumophila]MDW8905667.1 methyltransferase domain-containing protein [Legionella pneumophila]MDW8914644.1 methyltransferase domain-containing protein [Legionella pneum